MDTVVKRLYEGLFLVDSGDAASDWDGIVKAIEKVIARGEGEIASLNKWDERKLAYEVGGKARGTYLLAYFYADSSKIASIERDVQLSERLMRVLVLRTDRMSKEDLEKATPAMVAQASVAAEAEKAAQAAAEKAAQAEAEKAAAETEKAAEAETETVETPQESDQSEPAVEGEPEALAADSGGDAEPQEAPESPDADSEQVED